MRCRWCLEPWYSDTLHEIAAEVGCSWERARKAFAEHGCGAFECATLGEMRRCPRAESKPDEIVTLAQEWSGDDIDGLESDLEMAVRMGLL